MLLGSQSCFARGIGVHWKFEETEKCLSKEEPFIKLKWNFTEWISCFPSKIIFFLLCFSAIIWMTFFHFYFFPYTSNLVVIISTFFYILIMYWECLYALEDFTQIENVVTIQILQIVKPSFWEIKWLAQGFTFYNRKARIWNHSCSDYKAFLHNQQGFLTLSKFFYLSVTFERQVVK